ncbi:MAG: hypothetical protein IJA02_09080 [Clostridia bacterium]|nr:hypothetical protein [Clostridia bacterium]
MKKLSIILALIMALSCFSVTAFAQEEASSTEPASVEESSVAEESSAPAVEESSAPAVEDESSTAPTVNDDTTTTTAAATTTVATPATVIVNIVLEKLDGSEEKFSYTYSMKAGTVLTAADVLAAAKSRLDESGKAILDTEEYVISEAVIAEDAYGKYVFNKTTVDAGETYEYTVCAVEIDDVKNLAVTIGEQLAKLDWGGIAKANVALWNQIINGTKAAVDSLVNAEWPTAEDKAEATEATTAAAEETPDTGVSAVAGAAVVVLALSATTAVVLRKKED